MKSIRILLWIVTNHLVQTFPSSSHDCACPPGSYIKYRSSDGIYRCPPRVREVQSWAECKAIGEKCTNPIGISEDQLEYILEETRIFRTNIKFETFYPCIPGFYVKSGAKRSWSIFTCPEPLSRIESWSECLAIGTSCTNAIVLDDNCNLEYFNVDLASRTVTKSCRVFSNYVENKIQNPMTSLITYHFKNVGRHEKSLSDSLLGSYRRDWAQKSHICEKTVPQAVELVVDSLHACDCIVHPKLEGECDVQNAADALKHWDGVTQTVRFFFGDSIVYQTARWYTNILNERCKDEGGTTLQEYRIPTRTRERGKFDFIAYCEPLNAWSAYEREYFITTKSTWNTIQNSTWENIAIHMRGEGTKAKCNETYFGSLTRDDMQLSWDVLNKISSSLSNQNDKNFEAKRLLCVIYTYHKNIEKARAIDATWGKDCDKIVFGTDIEESRLSFSIKVEHPGPETYFTIGLKVWSFLKRIYEDYGDDFDWIFVSGDDTFLMVEHLRQYLATLKDEEALYLGRRWALPERAELPAWTNNLIFNLGAGYVLNRKALKLWYETCSNAYTLYESIQSGEDIAMAECLRRANVLPLDTRDKFGAERFHAFTPSQTAKIRYDSEVGRTENERNMRTNLWVWAYSYSFDPLDEMDGISDSSVLFHYVDPKLMRSLYFAYKSCVLGSLNSGSRRKAIIAPFSKEGVDSRFEFIVGVSLPHKILGRYGFDVEKYLHQACSFENLKLLLRSIPQDVSIVLKASPQMISTLHLREGPLRGNLAFFQTTWESFVAEQRAFAMRNQIEFWDTSQIIRDYQIALSAALNSTIGWDFLFKDFCHMCGRTIQPIVDILPYMAIVREMRRNLTKCGNEKSCSFE